MTEPSEDFDSRLTRLERKMRLASAAALIGIAMGIAGIATGFHDTAHAAASDETSTEIIDSLRVRNLDVVDANGVTRVRLAAPLPMAKIDGKRVTRGGGAANTISGIALYDATGGERSGYATNDRGYSNVFLTLDSAGAHQHALFISEPTGATTLRLFNGASNAADDKIDVAVTKDGPSLELVRDGKTILHQPPE